MEQHRRYRSFLFHILGFAIIFLFFASYEYYKYSVPDTICMKTDSTQQIDWNIPASGIVMADSSQVVSFQKPVTIITGSEEKTYAMDLKLFGVVPLKQIDVEIVKTKELIPLGSPIGIYMKTQGALVLDTGSFLNAEGVECSPAKDIIFPGDYLIAMDGVAITGKNQVREYIEHCDGKKICFQVRHGKAMKQVEVVPEKFQGMIYKAGMWLRDSAQGIGTITYIDDDLNFGALGHGINDIDVGELLELGSGLLYKTEIVSIKKGAKGEPGEITGLILYEPDQICGVITQNSNLGIYGNVSEDLYEKRKNEKIPVAYKQDVEFGPAKILCQFGKEKKYYDITITGLDYNNPHINQRIAFKVTDENLLKLTGGIVQGMSGSPIIQNGKFIGAVTHVFINDPTKGYGIFIENMLE